MGNENTRKKLRVAHIAGGLTTGGVEQVIYNYCARLDPADYELVYITYDTPTPAVQARFEALGFTVYSVTKKKDNLLRSCREVMDIFRRHRINVVHSHMTLMSFITSFLGLRCGVPVRVAHAHLALRSTWRNRPIHFLCRTLTKMFSTDLFACGLEAGRFLYGDRAVARGQVRVMHNAVDPARFAPDAKRREERRAARGIGDRLCLGHVGRFTDQKNHTFLVEIFAAFHRRRPDSVLLLIGDGPLFDDTRRKVEALGIADAVLFAGPTDRIEDDYQAMDVFVLPSLYEGLAVVLVETQLAGLPILTSDTVTREIACSDAMRYLPLGAGADAWADAAEDLARMGRQGVPQALLEGGYDIARAAAWLDGYYRRALGGEERV